MKIFICSPYKGDVKKNVENARAFARFVTLRGHLVFAPHLLYPRFLDDTHESERNMGFIASNFMITTCDELWAPAKDLSDCTEGMLKEIDFAKAHNIPIKFIDPDSIDLSHYANELPEDQNPIVQANDKISELQYESMCDNALEMARVLREIDKELRKAAMTDLHEECGYSAKALLAHLCKIMYSCYVDFNNKEFN